MIINVKDNNTNVQINDIEVIKNVDKRNEKVNYWVLIQ